MLDSGGKGARVWSSHESRHLAVIGRGGGLDQTIPTSPNTNKHVLLAATVLEINLLDVIVTF